MMKAHPLRAVVYYALAAFGAASANAHHASTAGFTTNNINVEGVVTEFQFANPHLNIYLDVTDENGEVTQWIATGESATGARRKGWTAKTIQPGQHVRINGREARNGVPMVLMSLGTDLAALLVRDPNDGLVLRAVEESDYQELVGTEPLALTLSNGLPNFTGAWTAQPGVAARPTPGAPPAPFNEAGSAAQANYDPVLDPSANCAAPGLVRQAAYTPHPVHITQNADHVALEYEEYAGRRIVYLDGRGSSNTERSNLGYSEARYDGDMLVIETSHLLGNYMGTVGNPLSDQTTTVETYRRMDDPNIGPALAMEMVITDPGHLSAPWTLRWLKYFTSSYEFIEVDCRVPLTYRDAESALDIFR